MTEPLHRDKDASWMPLAANARPHLRPLVDPQYRSQVAARLVQNVVITDTACWEWQRFRTSDGYGKISVKGRMVSAHQVSLFIHQGPWPADLHIDHLCRNRACCNPEHLEPVTPGENALRGALARPLKTHCPKGHSLDDGYTGADRRSKTCRECHRVLNREYQRRKRAAMRPTPEKERVKQPTRAKHGTVSRYVLGCKCPECRSAKAAYSREYRQRQKGRGRA